MNEEKIIWLSGHKLEFQRDDFDRKFDIYIQEPDSFDEETGLMLISEGLGGLASSNSMKEMRKDWCNRYNVITLGLNYLGSRSNNIKGYKIPVNIAEKLFSMMSDENKKDWIDKGRQVMALFNYFPNEDLTKQGIIIEAMMNYPEDRSQIRDYPDFGYIQAMDCLYAIKYVLDNYYVNRTRIFAYGSSFGGYLMQMCSKFAPATFSLVADVSGYAKPDLLAIRPGQNTYNRQVLPNRTIFGARREPFYIDNYTSNFYFTEDMEMIRTLSNKHHANTYSKYFDGKIVMFHSAADPLVNVNDKKELEKIYINAKVSCKQYLFTEKDIDGEIIKGTGHCMNGDLKKLFEKYCGEYITKNNKKDKKTDFDLKHQIAYPCKKSKYIIDYSDDYPTIKAQGKKE